jgi:hypothetical protein
MCREQIIEILQAGLTPLIAIIATYIAWQQWRANANKLRLDLFEKRYAVFDATRMFLSIILRDAKFEMKDFYEFRAGVSDSSFLFRNDVVEYLKKIDNEALKFKTRRDEYKDLPKGNERKRLVSEANEVFEWLINQLPELKNIFISYLGFKKV